MLRLSSFRRNISSRLLAAILLPQSLVENSERPAREKSRAGRSIALNYRLFGHGPVGAVGAAGGVGTAGADGSAENVRRSPVAGVVAITGAGATIIGRPTYDLP
jgi:hypothetical protein